MCTKIGTPSGGKGLRQRSAPIEMICDRCDFRLTKPGGIPMRLAPLIVTAHRMEALFESGAGAPYPSVFTPLEWDAFLTLKHARAKDQEKDFPKKPDAKTAAQAALDARLGRG